MNDVVLAQGSFDKAKRLYEEAQAIRKEALGPDHLDFLRHSAEMFKKEVRTLFRLRASGIATSLAWFLVFHPLFSSRARLSSCQGELDNAGALYEQIQSIHEEKLGRRHPEVATALTERAGVLAKKVIVAGGTVTSIENSQQQHNQTPKAEDNRVNARWGDLKHNGA